MNILQEFDTIAAVSTPLGTGGVGVIRVSGDKSFDIVTKITHNMTFPAGKICHGWVYDGLKQIDEVIILPFKAPKSYTGEDVIEIQCHGGVQVVQNILDIVLRNGARQAIKGEFTKRAFLNKRMDLSQAEAVDDLIHSKTSDFAICSAKNLAGALADKIKDIRDKLFKIASLIVAATDFPEDVQEPEYELLIDNFNYLLKEINGILAGAKSSDILRQGIKVAIVGRPNVGKSSLFNTLLNLNRAIVTDVAGTTRDVIKENIDLGLPITLIDTAGIRDDNQTDKVESIGIEYSKNVVKEADLILFLFDIQSGLTKEDNDIFNLIKEKKHVVIANKTDLPHSKDSVFAGVVKLSTKTKEGIQLLKDTIKSKVLDLSPENLEFVTNKRQQSCLYRAKEALERALEAAKSKEIQDMIYIDLKTALLALDELSGEVINDEILDNIFSNFCIGK